MSDYYDKTQPNHSAAQSDAPLSETDERKRMGRRALIAAAGLGVVGIGAAEAPKILDGVGQLTNQEIQNAINFGRQQLAKELVVIEDIAINTAIEVADVTRGAVDNFVVPIVSILTSVTEVTLNVARGTVEKVQGAAGLINLDIAALTQLDGILKAWQDGVAKVPQTVKAIGDTDTTHAHTYLAALKLKLDREAASK